MDVTRLGHDFGRTPFGHDQVAARADVQPLVAVVRGTFDEPTVRALTALAIDGAVVEVHQVGA